MMYWLVSNRSYPCNVGVVTTEKAARAAWKKYSNPGEVWPLDGKGDRSAWTVSFPGNNGLHPTFLIWVCLDLEKSKDSWVAGVVAHECTHVAQYLWEQIGEQEPGKEAEAYLIGLMTCEILEHLWGSDR
jgi:hypothetical protein